MGETVGFDDVLLDQIIFDAKRETLQLSRSVTSLDGAIRRRLSGWWDWNSFEYLCGTGFLKDKREAGLKIYRQAIGDAIEARLPADLKADVLRKDQRRGRTKRPKADFEKTHQKWFEEGYQAAMREVELQKEKEKQENPSLVQEDGRQKGPGIMSYLMMVMHHNEGRYVLLDSPCSKTLTISFTTQTLVRTTKSRRGTQVQEMNLFKPRAPSSKTK